MKPIVTGIKEIDRTLRRLEPKIAKKLIRQSMRAALKPVRAAVIASAPVGETGQLRKAVKLKAGPRRKGVIELDVQIGAGSFKGETYYGAMVELGTKKQQAQHYMREAFEKTAPAAKALGIELIGKGILQEAKK
jgi:HK97 gp10 family phage protein